jgi:hypothetical protein
MVSVYRVPQMQGVGCADVLLYFKCPTTMQMRYPVNAYQISDSPVQTKGGKSDERTQIRLCRELVPGGVKGL